MKLIKPVICGLVALLLSVSSSAFGQYGYSAGHRSAGYGYYQNGYYQNQYYAPTYSPVVVGVPLSTLGINYFFSVDPQKREERIIEHASQAAIEQLKAQGYTKVEEPTEPQEEQSGVGAEDFNLFGSAPQAPPKQPPAQAPSPELQKEVLTLMRSKCMGCHKPGDVKNGIKLFDAQANLAEQTVEQKMQILGAIMGQEGLSQMPPQKPLDKNQKALIWKWLNQ